MKRNLVIISILFLGIVISMILANFIIIGEKLAQVTHVWQTEYVFYLILLLIVSYFILLPIIKIYRSPEIPPLSIDNMKGNTDLFDFGKKLANHCGYLNINHRKKHKSELISQLNTYAGDTKNLRIIIKNELNLRIEGDEEKKILGINKRIKEWAKTVFMITAVSQNSKFDTLAALVLNFKMIEDIILASGFRPTTPQLYKLYLNILATSLITYCASELFNDMDGVSPLDFTDNANIEDITIDGMENLKDGAFFTKLLGFLSKLKIPGFIVGSALDGATNALITLRLGHVTKYYLINGIQESKSMRRTIKREAMVYALKTIPTIISESSAVVGEKVAERVKNIYQSK